MAAVGRTRLTFAAGAAAGIAATRAWQSPQGRFARMSGSSVAAPDAAGWVTDFLNAAYYRRPPEGRDVDDLRLAFGIVTTRWQRLGRRLRIADAAPFHRAFGRHRFMDGSRSPRGTLDRAQLVEGAVRLLGDWFPGAWDDDARRAWGIAFSREEDKASYRPEQRLLRAALGELTPPIAAEGEQTWHTYPAVAVPSAERALGAIVRPETWPDYATEVGRFTPVRSRGLDGQTFEIEVAAGTTAGAPVFTRGYVTITRLVTAAVPEALDAYVSELNDALARFGSDEPAAVPAGARTIAAFDLTTHEGHFMGRGRNRLLLFEDGGQAYLRAAGTWDPMPWHIEQAYARAGRDAQHEFWGQDGRVARSMLHQIALRTAPA